MPGAAGGRRAGRRTTNAILHRMVFPAYDQCIKASHVFNLLDARGVISVTERQSYILRVRDLAKACGEAFLQTEAGGWPYLPLDGGGRARSARVGVHAGAADAEAGSLSHRVGSSASVQR